MNTNSYIPMIFGHSFHARFFDHDSTIVDLGAHKGQFASEMIKNFGCRCYLVEALPVLFSQIAGDRLIQKFNFAMAGRDEPVELFVSGNPEGNTIIGAPADGSGGSVTVEGVTLETFMARAGIGVVDLLKVDIEGAEVGLFEAASDEVLSNITQITVEFHDFVPGAVSADEVAKIKKRLQGLGFYVIQFSRSTNADVLFINRKLSQMSRMEYWYIKYVVKYSRGIGRILRSHFPHGAKHRR